MTHRNMDRGELSLSHVCSVERVVVIATRPATGRQKADTRATNCEAGTRDQRRQRRARETLAEREARLQRAREQHKLYAMMCSLYTVQ